MKMWKNIQTNSERKPQRNKLCLMQWYLDPTQFLDPMKINDAQLSQSNLDYRQGIIQNVPQDRTGVLSKIRLSQQQ